MFLLNSFPWSKTKKIALYIFVILLGIDNRASAIEADKIPLKNNYIYESALKNKDCSTLKIYNVFISKSNNYINSNHLAQLIRVERLKDVNPGDWAYEALRSLVDRYNCISGFPKRTAQAGEVPSLDVSSQTYRGNRTLKRAEFAAGLNSC